MDGDAAYVGTAPGMNLGKHERPPCFPVDINHTAINLTEGGRGGQTFIFCLEPIGFADFRPIQIEIPRVPGQQ